MVGNSSSKANTGEGTIARSSYIRIILNDASFAHTMQIALIVREKPVLIAVSQLELWHLLQECHAHGIQAIDVVEAALADLQTQLLCKLIENVWVGFEGQPSLAHAG